MNAPLPLDVLEEKNLGNLVLSSTEERALTLLGQGVEPSAVAFAVGVSESRISQLISDPHFAARVAELRYVTLAKHGERDNAYDSLEDTLVDKMRNMLPMMFKPMEVLAAIRVINAAKRRGSGVNPTTQNQAPVVQLTMPVQFINQFTLNAANQVIKAGQQDLITVQSGSMQKLLDAKKLEVIQSRVNTLLEDKNVQLLERTPVSAGATG